LEFCAEAGRQRVERERASAKLRRVFEESIER
jgi:hypothetical protein